MKIPYAEIILEEYENPKNLGTIKKPTITASAGNPICGDRIVVTMKIKNKRIEEIKFSGDGCAISIAAASIITEKIKGKTLKEAKKIKDEELLKELGNVIQTRVKCALISKITIQKAIEEWEKNPNKKEIEIIL